MVQNMNKTKNKKIYNLPSEILQKKYQRNRGKTCFMTRTNVDEVITVGKTLWLPVSMKEIYQFSL